MGRLLRRLTRLGLIAAAGYAIWRILGGSKPASEPPGWVAVEPPSADAPPPSIPVVPTMQPEIVEVGDVEATGEPEVDSEAARAADEAIGRERREAPATGAPSDKSSAQKAPVQKAAAQKAAAQKAAAPKASSQKAAAQKAAAKKPAVKKAAAKKPDGTEPAAKEPAAKKAAPKKAATKRSAATKADASQGDAGDAATPSQRPADPTE